MVEMVDAYYSQVFQVCKGSLCTISFTIPSYLALAPFSNQSHISFFLPLLGIDIDDPKKQIKMGLFFCTFLKKWFCPWNQIFIGFSLNFKGDKHNFQSFFICENLIECTGHVKDQYSHLVCPNICNTSVKVWTKLVIKTKQQYFIWRSFSQCFILSTALHCSITI